MHSLLIVLFVWGQSKVWVSVKLFPQREAFHRSITYYPPKQSFRAAEGRAPSVRTRPRVKHAAVQPSHPTPMPVTPEHKPSLVTPPDIKQATAKLPNFPAPHPVAPTMPLSASAGPRRTALAGPSAVVAPPPKVDPEVDRATARRAALPEASAVAPAPELGAPSARRAVSTPNMGGLRVVPPPPSVQNGGNSAGAGRQSSLSGAGLNVVPPPPSVQRAGNATGDARLASMAGSGAPVVPPPPSVQNAGNSAGAGRMHGVSPAGSQVVPPPPSVQGSGVPAGGTRLGSLPGAGPNVVPAPPSVPGAGNAGVGRLGSMAGAGSPVVPPPPAVQGGGIPAGGTRLGSLSGTGSEVVPPPPSVASAGDAGAVGRLRSLSSNGAGNGLGDSPPITPPPPPAAASGNSGAGGPGKLLEPMDPLTADTASNATGSKDDNEATIEGLPLGLIGVVFAAPGTSFFSNFEVFVAKRRVGKGQLQLIKLVYEFLPYQRRLSEYNLGNLTPRVIKLRVIPDPSCDESLGQMMQSDTDPTRFATEYAKLPAALRNSDLTAVLPCYRTNAGDFQKAMSQGR